MEASVEFEVKIVSTETVKPSIPTPCHLKTFRLSYVDQILPLIPPFLSTGIVFYTRTASTETQQPDITLLKTCLSKTLSIFYPLAGRVEESRINCNDEGIPFIEAKVSCPLSAVLSSNCKLDLMKKFLPPRESLGIRDEPVTELVHLSIQISVFSCGGVAIGWYDIHKVMDGTSSATFFKHWSALVSRNYDDIVHQPNFDAAVTAFPPSPGAEQLPLVKAEHTEDPGSRTVVRRFRFKAAAISNLKATAASEQVPKPTSYLALAGFIWERAIQSKTAALDRHIDTILQATIDMRPWINPPLPKGSIGNLINTAVARAEKRTRMPELVLSIHAAVSKLKGEIIMQYKGEKGVKAVRAKWDAVIDILSEYDERAYKLVSWSKLGFSELDFGFGKPKWMVPTDGRMTRFHRNLIILIDYKDSNGDHDIEAWFFLEEKEMEILESDEEFLAFASPVY